MKSVTEDKRNESNLKKNNTQENKKNKSRLVLNYTVKLTILIIAIGLGLLHYLSGDKKGIDPIILGLFVIAIIPWLSNYLESIEAFGVKAVLSRIEEQQVEQKDEITDISARLLTLFLSPSEYSILNGMSESDSWPIDADHFDLQNEIRRLFALKLIVRRTGKGFTTLFINDGPDDKHHRNIKKHFKITERGEQYLEMMKRIENEQAKK